MLVSYRTDYLLRTVPYCTVPISIRIICYRHCRQTLVSADTVTEGANEAEAEATSIVEADDDDDGDVDIYRNNK